MKIRNSIIRKLHNLSSTEMNLFLHLIKREDQSTGVVKGVYYRDVMKYTGMCKQSFYNALCSLQEKQLIVVTRDSRVDYDVCILDNACSTEQDRAEGYVTLNRKAFRSQSFKKLKAHEKYLLFEFLKSTHEKGHSMKRKVKEFYTEWTKILGVSERVLRGYLHNLKQFFYIGIKKGMYYITVRYKLFEKLQNHDPGYVTEREWYLRHQVRKECNRLHIRYDEAALNDTAYLAIQYSSFADDTGNAMQLLPTLESIIRDSVEGIRYSERTLKNQYIHILLRKALKLPETATK